MQGWTKWVGASACAWLAVGCSAGAPEQGLEAQAAGQPESVAVTRQAAVVGEATITVRAIEYWFDEGFDLLDDRDIRARVSIAGSATYTDLEPGCCSGTAAIEIPRPSSTTWTKDVPLGTVAPVKIELFEDDDGGNDPQDIHPGPGDAINLLVDVTKGTVAGDFTDSFCTFSSGCNFCSGPRGQGDGLCFNVQIAQNCNRPEFFGDSTETLCDGFDNDCDGVADQNFTPSYGCQACSAPSTCSNGKETFPACIAECNRGPVVPGEWQLYINAWDFDVANDKLCMMPAVAAGGTLGNPICTIQANGNNSQFIEVPAPQEFRQDCTVTPCKNYCDTTQCQSRISLDANGRVWATNPLGVWTTQGDNMLHLVAAKPPGCSTIEQIELFGATDRNYFGPTARPLVRCGTSLYELVPGEARYIAQAPVTLSMGASPMNGFDLFLNVRAPNATTSLVRMRADNGTSTLWPLSQTDTIGGVFVVSGPNFNSTVRQWSGVSVETVADLTQPLQSPGFEGRYPWLYARLTEAGGAIKKVEEGGGLGVGGPSPMNTTDVLWILNDTYRIYSYNLAQIPSDLPGILRGDDRIPVTAQFATIPGQTPQALCHDVVLTAGANCSAAITPQLVNAGSSDPNGDALTLSLNVSGSLPKGSSVVVLTASDGQTSSSCTATVTVNDSTAPVITLPSTASAGLCQASGSVNVGQATATDNCSATVTGQVIARNGVTLSPAVDVVAGQAVLAVGSNTIRWRASDGVNQTERLQTVNVGSKIQANRSFIVGNGAFVQLPTGEGAALFNSGNLETRVGTDARVGSISSVAAVQVLDRTSVQGPIVSAAGVSVAATASTGPITRFGTVSLPTLPSLPTFPSPTGGNFTVNDGVTQSKAPGSYGTVLLNGGSTLTLSAGDYFFQRLTINSNVRVIVTANTRIFVKEQLDYRSQFILANGTAQPITLGFGGTGTLFLEKAFSGTLIAPAAQVVFGSASATTNSGSFFARIIEVRPGSVLACLP